MNVRRLETAVCLCGEDWREAKQATQCGDSKRPEIDAKLVSEERSSAGTGERGAQLPASRHPQIKSTETFPVVTLRPFLDSNLPHSYFSKLLRKLNLPFKYIELSYEIYFKTSG